MTVYIVQNQMRKNQQTGQLEPVFDFTSAAEFGLPEYLLSPNANPFGNIQDIRNELHEKLSLFRDEDYLLLVGSPILIGIATTLAAEWNEGKVNFLQWNGKEKRYTPLSVKIF